MPSLKYVVLQKSKWFRSTTFLGVQSALRKSVGSVYYRGTQRVTNIVRCGWITRNYFIKYQCDTWITTWNMLTISLSAIHKSKWRLPSNVKMASMDIKHTILLEKWTNLFVCVTYFQFIEMIIYFLFQPATWSNNWGYLHRSSWIRLVDHRHWGIWAVTSRLPLIQFCLIANISLLLWTNLMIIYSDSSNRELSFKYQHG